MVARSQHKVLDMIKPFSGGAFLTSDSFVFTRNQMGPNQPRLNLPSLEVKTLKIFLLLLGYLVDARPSFGKFVSTLVPKNINHREMVLLNLLQSGVGRHPENFGRKASGLHVLSYSCPQVSVVSRGVQVSTGPEPLGDLEAICNDLNITGEQLKRC